MWNKKTGMFLIFSENHSAFSRPSRWIRSWKRFRDSWRSTAKASPSRPAPISVKRSKCNSFPHSCFFFLLVVLLLHSCDYCYYSPLCPDRTFDLGVYHPRPPVRCPGCPHSAGGRLQGPANHPGVEHHELARPSPPVDLYAGEPEARRHRETFWVMSKVVFLFLIYVNNGSPFI